MLATGESYPAFVILCVFRKPNAVTDLRPKPSVRPLLIRVGRPLTADGGPVGVVTVSSFALKKSGVAIRIWPLMR